MQKSTLQVPKSTQIRVAEDLIENSRLDASFYLMLVLSTIVVTLGLLVGNTAVIIGGMLITPLMTPILALSLGIVISDKLLIWRAIKTISRAVGIILGVSVLISFFFPLGINEEIKSRLVSNIPYFLIAFSAGLAATFAWSKKNMSAMLPGVAIAVSLLPPLSVVGIGISQISIELVRGSFLSFILNLFGIALGSVIVFSLLNFHKTKKETAKVMREEIRAEEQQKEAVIKNGIKEELKKEQVIKEEVKKELKKEIKAEIEKQER